jgi:predicted DNA-binding transcriptional regulator YafY
MIYKLTQRLTYINHLIKTQKTGSPKEMAEKLGVSERCWYKLRDELVNDLQLPIAYCNYRKTYYYTTDGNLEIGFKPLNADKAEKIKGGLSPLYFQTARWVQ